MKIGKLELDHPLCLAPMEDVTDMPFRVIAKRLGADLVYTEFTSSEAVIRDVKKAIKKISVCEEERPVSIQLFGGVEESMELAAAKAESLGPDFIDINCGCWVKNHVARGEGAALLKDLPRFERIVKSTVKGTKLPVTVKTRLGWDEETIVILDVARMLEQAGVHALTVHCRTRSQAHDKKPADWTWLEKLKKTVQIPIIGNGDVCSPEDAKRMLETGCDGVMIGRAAIGNPWIFKQIKHYLKHGTFMPEPSLEERVKICLDHMKLFVKVHGEARGIYSFRKFYAGYFKGFPNGASLRKDLMQLVEVKQIETLLNQFCAQNTFQLT